MALNITFFDNVKYNSVHFTQRFADFFGAGVVNLTDFPLTFSSPANMTVNVGTGVAWINGMRISNDNTSTIPLTFANADPTNPRIDIIQIGYTSTVDGIGGLTGSPVLQIKQGIPAASPIEPGPDPNFVKLYAVNIAANQTTVTSANIIDRRTRVPLNVDGSQITNFSGVSSSYLNAIISDLFGNTSVVLSGGVATKDGTVPNQLDVTACNVYFGTGQHVSFPVSQNGQFVTSTPNATYYLDYNPDGTTSWGTSHSVKSGYVTICTVTTDASGNISTVTDTRPTVINLFGSTDKVAFGGNVQAPEFIATSTTAPLQLPNLSSLPGQVGAAGTIVVVNNQWYVSNGTSWVAMSAQIGNATTTTPGVVETSVAPSGTPVAVITNDPVYQNAARKDQANTFTQNQTAPVFISNAPQGTAPFQVTSTTAVTNLNADQVDGHHASDFILTSQQGVANGVATLDSTGNVPMNQLGNLPPQKPLWQHISYWV